MGITPTRRATSGHITCTCSCMSRCRPFCSCCSPSTIQTTSQCTWLLALYSDSTRNSIICTVWTDNSPSVLSCCWLGIMKCVRPVKNRLMRCEHCYLPGARSSWFAYGPVDATATPWSLASLKHTQIGSAFLVPAYPGCPGKDAIKWVSGQTMLCGGAWFARNQILS